MRSGNAWVISQSDRTGKERQWVSCTYVIRTEMHGVYWPLSWSMHSYLRFLGGSGCLSLGVGAWDRSGSSVFDLHANSQGWRHLYPSNSQNIS
eukprot:2330792-Amphidinium_carterae.1